MADKNRSFGQGAEILVLWPVLIGNLAYYCFGITKHLIQSGPNISTPNRSSTLYIQWYTVKNNDFAMIVKVEILMTHSVLYYEVRLQCNKSMKFIKCNHI